MPTTGTVRYLYPGQASIVAHCEGKDSNACLVSVSAPPSGPGANKPSDCVRFAESPMTGPTAGTGAFGTWTDANPYSIAGVGFGSDSAEPFSPPGCRTDRLYKGMTPGVGSGAGISGWASPAIYYRKLYACWTYKLVETAYYAGGIYPGTKIGFICYGNDTFAGGNSGVIDFRHDAGETWLSACQVQLLQQGNVARALVQNVDATKRFIMGSWNILEHVCLLNTLGAADGIYQQWVNGYLTTDYRDVVWRTSNAVNPFCLFRPGCLTWGGGGSASKPNDENFRTGHVYLAGIPYAA